MTQKKLPRHRKSVVGRVDSSVRRHTQKKLTLFGAIMSGFMSFTLFPPPSEPPDISWRAQGQDMKNMFGQVNGFFDAVYRGEVAGRDVKKH